jgi:uncharacterized protein YbjT (DUF2867 family)
MILVTILTGRIGQHVFFSLLKVGAPVRVVLRGASKLPDDIAGPSISLSARPAMPL